MALFAANIVSFLLTLLVVVFAVTIVIATLSFAPWLPIRRKEILRVFTIAQLQHGDIFYDLGCGDGRIVVAAAQRTRARAVGVELALPQYLMCLIRKAFHLRLPITFRYGNLFNAAIADADVVYLFGLSSKLGPRLTKKFQQDLRPGTRIVSYAFPIQGWTPVRVDHPAGMRAVYLYSIPEPTRAQH